MSKPRPSRKSSAPPPPEQISSIMPQADFSDNPLDTVAGDGLATLRRCLDWADSEAAWGELFLFIEQTVSGRVRALLRCLGFDPEEAEVVVLELCEHLYWEDCRKLRTCRAESDARFRAWLLETATNFTLRWAKRQRRGQKRLDQAGESLIDEIGLKAALFKFGEADRSGPDEGAIEAWLAECQALMRRKDFDRLLVLMCRSTAERPIFACTERRWIRQLVYRYPHLFGKGR